MMIRILAALALLFGIAGAATGAAAVECVFKIDDYVAVNWAGEANQPAKVRSLQPLGEGEPCYYQVRMLDVPGRSILYTVAVKDGEIAPFTGTLPYDKTYGCPFDVGDAVDYTIDRFADDAYRPAIVTGLTEECDVDLTYQAEGGDEVAVNVIQALLHTYIRPGELTAKTDAELEAERVAKWQAEEDAAVAAEAAMHCTLDGLLIGDIGDDDPLALAKRGIISELIERTKTTEATFHVRFNKVSAGRAFVVADPSTFLTNNDDAIVGETATPYRVEVEACAEVPDKPADTVSNTRIDYICYLDLYEDYVCRQQG